jgi:tRNA C32,U32 (ribose-2'-O)-methylase TrmJ
MTQAGLTQAGNPDKMLLRLRRSLQRASLTQRDISVWRGVLSKIEIHLL